MPSATICVDLDGTIAEYSGWEGVGIIGAPKEDAVGYLQDFRRLGVRVHVWTCRLVTEALVRWFIDHQVPIWGVNGWICEYSPAILLEELEPLDEEDLNAFGYPTQSEYAGVPVLLHQGGKPQAAAYIDDRGIGLLPKVPEVARVFDWEKVVQALQYRYWWWWTSTNELLDTVYGILSEDQTSIQDDLIPDISRIRNQVGLGRLNPDLRHQLLCLAGKVLSQE